MGELPSPELHSTSSRIQAASQPFFMLEDSGSRDFGWGTAGRVCVAAPCYRASARKAQRFRAESGGRLGLSEEHCAWLLPVAWASMERCLASQTSDCREAGCPAPTQLLHPETHCHFCTEITLPGHRLCPATGGVWLEC